MCVSVGGLCSLLQAAIGAKLREEIPEEGGKQIKHMAKGGAVGMTYHQRLDIYIWIIYN